MGKWRYGIVLDAGSSGTRIHIYRWLNSHIARINASPEELKKLPSLETKKKWIKKKHPGISTYGEKPDLVGPEYLDPLFEHALEYVPAKEVPNTPVFLLATAGMRLLPKEQRKVLLERICKHVQTTTAFQLPDCGLHIQVIPGETEGLYGWIAANYLLGGFDRPESHDHGKNHHTYGFLDMGGASAQIAFAPNATETAKHANDLKLLRMRTIDGAEKEYRVFVATWLEYGVHEARRRYLEALAEAHPKDADELPDPCLPAGLKVSPKGDPIAKGSVEEEANGRHIIGTGDFDECMRQTYPLLDKKAPCKDAPCLLHGIHTPAIDFEINHFVGVSEYWHTTHEVFEMGHKDQEYDYATYLKRVEEYCGQDWHKILDGVDKKKWGKKVDEKVALQACFKASWLINVLHDGIGVPRSTIESEHSHNISKALQSSPKQKPYLDPFQAVNKIDDIEVSWTLGKMVLYAASQVPPSASAKDVGFGKNIESGIPEDFQLAGGKPDILPPDVHEHLPDDIEAEDWHDVLLNDSPRRIPGVVIIVLIAFLAFFILCSRDRRRSARHRIRRFFPSSRVPGSPKRRTANRLSGSGGAGGLAGKLLNAVRRSNSPEYERVLESGPADDYELPNVAGSDFSDERHSDSSEGGGHLGRSSGWATPQLQTSTIGGSAANRGSGSSAIEQGYFDSDPFKHPLGISTMGANAGSGALPVPLKSPVIFGSEGLVSRTDSKERLPVLGYGLGAGSRATSPARRMRGTSRGPGLLD